MDLPRLTFEALVERAPDSTLLLRFSDGQTLRVSDASLTPGSKVILTSLPAEDVSRDVLNRLLSET